MCELLAAAFPEPEPFGSLVPVAEELERLGIAGFGWGVAWLEESGSTDAPAVRVVKGLGRFQDQAGGAMPEACSSRRFLVHLRRPSRLSTIQWADTQPFSAGTEHAWCHNGLLQRAEELRPRWENQLAGRADSEVGWAFFKEQLEAGVPAAEALRQVDQTFGGNVNLGYLDAGGTLLVFAHSATNPMWRFAWRGGSLAATSLHSDDRSLFDLIFRDASEVQRLAAGCGAEVGKRLPRGAALTAG
jgi:predicted glutamine amidotransferase